MTDHDTFKFAKTTPFKYKEIFEYNLRTEKIK